MPKNNIDNTLKDNVQNKETITEEEIEKECFVIMPISDPENYNKGHFKMVYDDIFKPAIKGAGFKPFRSDENKSSNLIQLEIIKKIIEAPIALCDLSAKNPNVLFELGIRQAFDKPVVLVEEYGTGKIFDVNSINTYDYRKECLYSEVIEDQRYISEALAETFEKHQNGECINSLVKLLNIEPAKPSSKSEINDKELLRVIFNEVMDLKKNVNTQRVTYYHNDNDNLEFRRWKSYCYSLTMEFEKLKAKMGDFNDKDNLVQLLEFRNKIKMQISRANRFKMSYLNDSECNGIMANLKNICYEITSIIDNFESTNNIK